MDLNLNKLPGSRVPSFLFVVFLVVPLTGSVLLCLFGCNVPRRNQSQVLSDSITTEPELNLKIEELDPQLQENSGIILYRGVFWTINDSGNDPVLYAFNPVSGMVVQQVFIINARNRDWEEITQDKDYIYIGDFGNNNGHRTHLQVYKIKKSDIPANQDAGVSAELISFQYGDQTGEPALSRSAYDCEAFFAWEDSLYLFSKNWQDRTSSLYVLSTLSGSYVVSPRSVFNADGLVTAADISKNGKIVTLLGYKDYIPFIWIFTGYTFPDIFEGSKSRFEFPSYNDLQTEGITIQNSDILYISCERSTFPPQVYWLDLSELLK